MIPDAEAKRYLEECATWCPHCHADLADNAKYSKTVRVHEKEAMPKFHAEWQCIKCGNRWTEIFTLSAVVWVENRNVVVGAKA
jgi:uncharacterized protein with PIN domain